MRSLKKRALCTAPLLLMLFACGETSDAFDGPLALSLLPAATAGRSVVLVDQVWRVATLLNVDDLSKPPTRVTLPHGAKPLVARPGDAGETLVLCRGLNDDPRSPDEAAALVVLNEDGEARRYPLNTRFDTMQVSEDGRYAMLYFSGNVPSESVLINPNEIAIVDLEQPASEGLASNPRSRTLRSFGSAPSRIVFSPEMEIAGEKRRLAVVLFDSVVLLIDLKHLDRPEYTVELANGTDRSIGLSQVVFDTETSRLYARGNQSTDIYVLTLSASGAGSTNDFVPSLNQLGLSSVPIDIALYTSDDEPRLLAITRDGTAVVVDTNTSSTTAFELPTFASQIQIYRDTSPTDPTVMQRALLYAHDNNQVMFLDLDDIERQGARNLETLRIQSTYSVSTNLGDNLVMLMHNGTGLSVLNLKERTVSPFGSSQDLGDAVPDLDAHKLWLANINQSQLAFLDLRDFHPGAIDLDRPIKEVVQIHGDGDLRSKLAVIHFSTVGHITVLDGEDPTDLSLADAARGFFLQNILDRADEETR